MRTFREGNIRPPRRCSKKCNFVSKNKLLKLRTFPSTSRSRKLENTALMMMPTSDLSSSGYLVWTRVTKSSLCLRLTGYSAFSSSTISWFVRSLNANGATTFCFFIFCTYNSTPPIDPPNFCRDPVPVSRKIARRYS